MDCDPCLRFEDEAVSFVLGDLDGAVRARMVSHLGSCSPCRREVAAVNAAVDVISASTAPVEPSPGFVDRVLASAEEHHLTPPLAAPSRPAPVVVRRRRMLLSLSAATAALAVAGVEARSWTLSALAVFTAALALAYLGLIVAVTRTRARSELGPVRPADDVWWRGLEPIEPIESSSAAPADISQLSAVAFDNAALARFVLSYFTGWLLTPVVVAIGVVRGDLGGVEQSSVLGRIVALQRQGRARSLRLLAAGVTTVVVAGGGTATATILLVPQVASAAPAPQTYVVRAGDTLSAIAQRYGVSVTHLARLNGISDPNVIVAGEVIHLGTTSPAASGASPAADGSGSSYTVQDGDTLDSIAERFGTTTAALAAANHLTDPNLIFAGQVLDVGGTAAAPTAAPSTSASPVLAARVVGPYTVQGGDTLDSIAERFGTTAAALAAANHLTDPKLILVGQVLAMPHGSVGAGTSEHTTADHTTADHTTAATTATTPQPTTSAPSSTPSPPASVGSGYVNPFTQGSWSPARIDQGVDWIPNAPSPVVAIGDGVITYSSTSSGWPGGSFISYRLTSGSHAGLYVYVAEHLTNLLPTGTVVHAGEQIATALPGDPWTEWGWASANGPAPAPGSQYNGAPDGTPTAGGKAFARFLISIGVTGLQSPGPGPTTP